MATNAASSEARTPFSEFIFGAGKETRTSVAISEQVRGALNRASAEGVPLSVC
jgi:hypothetical protein